MKHIIYAERSLLMGNAAADLLIEFGAVLARHLTADTVELRAIAPDGNETDITLLLGPGSVLLVESCTSQLPEPDNRSAESFLRDRITMLEAVDIAYPVDVSREITETYYEELDL